MPIYIPVLALAVWRQGQVQVELIWHTLLWCILQQLEEHWAKQKVPCQDLQILKSKRAKFSAQWHAERQKLFL